MIQYRHFRNDDPPGLALVWNEAFTGRAAVRLRHSSPLENFVFSKSYFDPDGLIVATDNQAPVGFVHAGFGPSSNESKLSNQSGVVSIFGVRPAYRRRGIGSELLRRSESYCAGKGAQFFYAGPMAPLNPFYFGLYGGSELAGFLASDPGVEPFLSKHGYKVHDSRLVLQRGLTVPVNIVDARFAAHRKRYDVRISPRSGPGTWWQECTTGPVEIVEFQLLDKTANKVVGHLAVWEMDLFSWRWSQPAVGILDIQVSQEIRRQGLAKFLTAQMLRYLQEQYFGMVEVHLTERDPVALKLFQSLGFEQVDVGRIFKK